MKIREVKRIVQGHATVDGAGVKLLRVLGYDDVRDIDPFLMLDAFGSDNPDDYIKGFPMHPHRGIETITYLLEGRIDHKDSLGNGGTLLDGDLQWMTAGSGILHEEMPRETETKVMRGLQFWLNLPRKEKLTPPHYFPITHDMVKNIDTVKVKLISGEYLGNQGVEPRHVKIMMMDVQLESNAEHDFPVADGLNTFVYLIDGSGCFGDERTPVQKHSAAVFDAGETIRVQAMSTGVRFVLMAGQPLKEPLAWGGPIVMNTNAELQNAFSELQNGTFIR